NDTCSDCAFWSTRLRPEFGVAYYDCLSDPATPCNDASVDSCAAKAAMSIPARGADTAYTAACMQKRNACGGDPFADDSCSAYALSDALLAQAQACLDRSCTDVGACVKSTFKP